MTELFRFSARIENKAFIELVGGAEQALVTALNAYATRAFAALETTVPVRYWYLRANIDKQNASIGNLHASVSVSDTEHHSVAQRYEPSSRGVAGKTHPSGRSKTPLTNAELAFLLDTGGLIYGKSSTLGKDGGKLGPLPRMTRERPFKLSEDYETFEQGRERISAAKRQKLEVIARESAKEKLINSQMDELYRDHSLKAAVIRQEADTLIKERDKSERDLNRELKRKWKKVRTMKGDDKLIALYREKRSKYNAAFDERMKTVNNKSAEFEEKFMESLETGSLNTKLKASSSTMEEAEEAFLKSSVRKPRYPLRAIPNAVGRPKGFYKRNYPAVPAAPFRVAPAEGSPTANWIVQARTRFLRGFSKDQFILERADSRAGTETICKIRFEESMEDSD